MRQPSKKRINYYPFGLRHNGYNNLQAGTQGGKFKFGGKELNDELDLDWYDFGVRNYDAALGRWMHLDPLAEQMRRFSPYNYAFNNPIYFFDNEGNIPFPAIINFIRRSSSFGLRIHPITGKLKGHSGVDLTAPVGTNVYAAAHGKVVKIKWDVNIDKNGKITGYGQYIVIEHVNGYYSLYAHLEKNGTMVSVGDDVSNGQLIATSGNTGGSTGPHLHFEIIKANSLKGVFDKANKINPESIYDLEEHVYDPVIPNLLMGTTEQWANYFYDLAFLENSSQVVFEESNTTTERGQIDNTPHPMIPLPEYPEPIIPAPIAPTPIITPIVPIPGPAPIPLPDLCIDC